jgi:hypothetical protein
MGSKGGEIAPGHPHALLLLVTYQKSNDDTAVLLNIYNGA